MRNDLIQFSIIDNFGLIQKERERLERLIEEQPEKLKTFWRWMPGWLSKTNEQHFAEKDQCLTCNVCGACEKEMLHSEFSFCDEYGCGITFCQKCAEGLSKVFEEAEVSDDNRGRD